MRNDEQQSSQLIDLYPLDTHLECYWPSFEYESTWTPRQIEVVTDYLEKHLPNSAYEAFVANLYWKISGGTRHEQVESILATHEPWDLRGVSHDAAVQMAPSLESLVASELESDQAVSLDDVNWWLYKNATLEQRAALFSTLFPDHSALPTGGADTFDLAKSPNTIEFSTDRLLEAWKGIGYQFELSPYSAPIGSRSSASSIRAWARRQGHKVGDRGRIPASIVSKYITATQQRR